MHSKDTPTIAGQRRELFERLLQRRGIAMDGPDAISPRSDGGPVPASAAQERLWFLDRLGLAPAEYNMCAALRIDGALHTQALVQAMEAMVERHDILRTHFVDIDGVPHQRIVPAGVQQVIDVTKGLPAHDLEAFVAAESVRPFDLANGPLFRARVVELAEHANVLVLSMHHIVSDAWSTAIFFRELAVCYAAIAKGREPSLPPLAVQYADYAIWQRERREEARLGTCLAYWKGQLAGAAPLLLPTDRPRPSSPSAAGDAVAFRVDGNVSRRFLAMVREAGATPYMGILAVWMVLLSRYAGQEDVVVGSPFAGRTHPQTADMIGFFLNTLVLRQCVRGSRSFRALLDEVRQTVTEAQANQDAPFASLVAALRPDRGVSRQPLFQVMLVVGNDASDGLVLDGLSLSPLDLPCVVSKFEMTLHVRMSGDALEGHMEFSTELFDSDSIRCHLENLEAAMQAVVQLADEPVASLDILAHGQRRRIVEEWNDTAVAEGDVAGVHAFFERQAARTPDAIAVEYGDEALTYAELDRRSDALAYHLRDLGVVPDDRIGLFVDRSIDATIGLLAVLKAGGAYVPLDREYPAERLAYMMEQAAPRVILTQSHLLASLPGTDVAVVLLDDERHIVPAGAGREPVAIEPHHLAYVIYTSGSIGRPKGVSLPHRALVNLMRWHFSTLRPALRTLQIASLSFDASFHEMFAAWGTGGTLVVPPENLRRDITGLLDFLAEQQIGKVIFPVVVLQQLAEVQATSGKLLPCLVEVMATGEQLQITQPVRRFFQRHPWCVLHNHYGPSESHVVTAYTFGPDTDAWATHPPIGKPIDNTQIYLLNERMRPVPRGATGELYIGGANLARGYFGRDELTDERFVPDPFGDPHTRLYRTGDLARYLPDGDIEFLGRSDHQVKIRGFRVELAEVEGALLQQDEVAECTVVTRDGASGDRQLIAYAVAANGAAMDAAMLRERLASILPSYMIPSAFVVVGHLPLNVNGKVDRALLPQPGFDDAATGGYEDPRVGPESLVAGIWRELLGLDRVGRHASFFDLGGHSLLAVRFTTRLRERHGLVVPLRQVFEHPTIAGIAACFQPGADTEDLPIRRIDRSGPLPASPSQERLWFLDRMEGGVAPHVLSWAMHMHGRLDVPALRGAMQSLMERHEALRTRFAHTGGVLIQVIDPEWSFPLTEIDLVARTEEERMAGMRRFVDEAIAAPFALADEPPIRAILVAMGQDHHVLVMAVHHIACDGWSLGILMHDLCEAYAAARAGHPLERFPLRVQSVDYAHWQRDPHRGPALRRQLDFWKERLVGAPPLLDLPTDRVRPNIQGYDGGSASITIDAGLGERIAGLARGEGATFFMVFHAAFTLLLSRLSGGDDVVVGTAASHRPHPDLEGVVGFFINTLALRMGIEPSLTVSEWVGVARRVAIEAYEHGDVPFEMVVDAIKPERSRGHSPIFQSMLVLQNAPETEWAFDGLSLSPVDIPWHASEHDLMLSVRECGAAFVATMTYRTDLFDGTTIERWLGYLRHLLHAFCDNPSTPIGAIPLLDDNERHRLLVERNAAVPSVAIDATIHQCIEAQCRRTPDAVAVTDGQVSLTYAQLDRRANQLARWLGGQGVGPGSLVGVSLTRNADLAWTLLGILKAGAAYLPLDPAYPEERLAYMVADASPRLILAHSSTMHRLGAIDGWVRIDALVHALDDLDGSSGPRRDNEVSGTDAAYVIYTSGSTGRPKGVVIEHRSTVNLMRWAASTHPAGVFSSTLFSTSLNFDLAVYECFVPWSVGGTVHVVSNAMALLDRQAPVTLVNTVPSAMVAWLDGGAIHPATQVVNLAGEVLKRELVERIFAETGVREVWNLYGPSETTTYSTWHRMTRDTGFLPGIGRPVANTRIYLLGEDGGPVPDGVVGEICIAGAGVARGYLGQVDAVDGKFLHDPFHAKGERMYRTGDRGRWAADGTLHYLGRKDRQVKLRGYRIEPGEIEAVLAAVEGVSEVSVLPRELAGKGPCLVAYVAAAGTAPDEGMLRMHAARSLPDYMLPAAYVVLDALPTTPNGKLDTAALPLPDSAAHPFAPEPFVGEREEALGAIWRDVLGAPHLGRKDNFFESGGHSLLVPTLLKAIEEHIGVRLGITDVFAYPNVEALAAFMAGGDPGDGMLDESMRRGTARRRRRDTTSAPNHRHNLKDAVDE